MTRLVALLAAVALLPACSDGGGSAQPAPGASSDTTAGPSAAPALAQRCESEEGGYAIRYPAQWFVADGPEIKQCAFFDDQPLMVEPQTEATGVAIRVDVRDVLLAQARRDALAEGDKTARDAEVAGRRAVRVEGTLTQEVLLPAGTRITSWLIELDGRTLILSADDAGAEDYEAAVEVLDQMAETVEVR